MAPLAGGGGVDRRSMALGRHARFIEHRAVRERRGLIAAVRPVGGPDRPMAERPRVLIAGGSGVFGRLLARDLLKTTSVDLILAGRGLPAVVAARRELDQPDRTSAMAFDLGDPESLTRAARGCVAVACAAGPFQELSPELGAGALRGPCTLVSRAPAGRREGSGHPGHREPEREGRRSHRERDVERLRPPDTRASSLRPPPRVLGTFPRHRAAPT